MGASHPFAQRGPSNRGPSSASTRSPRRRTLRPALGPIAIRFETEAPRPSKQTPGTRQASKTAAPHVKTRRDFGGTWPISPICAIPMATRSAHCIAPDDPAYPPAESRAICRTRPHLLDREDTPRGEAHGRFLLALGKNCRGESGESDRKRSKPADLHAGLVA